MRDLGQMLKVTAFFASGPDDGEDSEIYRNSGEELDDDFMSRDQLDNEFLWVSWLQQQCGIIRQLDEDHRQREAWLEEIRRDVDASEVSVSEIIRTSRDYKKNNAKTLDTFTHKIALLRQEIAEIVERP